MNIIKFLKPLLPAVLLASTGMFLVGCSSSSDDPAVATSPPPYHRQPLMAWPALPVSGKVLLPGRPLARLKSMT